MIYLDNAATTKPSQSALKFAENFITENYFNPSALYREGLKVSREIKISKEKIARQLNATSHDVIFTASGSESDNTAIFCSVLRGTYLTDKGEHSAVYKCFKELENRGHKVFYVDLNKDGSVNVENLLETVKNNKIDFISIMHVNNETGAINDINYIAKAVKNINKNVIFHSDGVQAFGKIPYRLSSDVDMYSISAHKINGLKGTGALIKKKSVKLNPLIYGGGQESGFRSGTENVFGIKVFEYVSEEHYKKINASFEHVLALKKAFISGLDKNLFSIISGENSSPYILSISAKGLKGEVIMHSLEEEGIIVGNGSACSSKNPFSRIIESAGHSKDVLSGIIRVSFSTENKLDEILFAVDKINKITLNLKEVTKGL